MLAGYSTNLLRVSAQPQCVECRPNTTPESGGSVIGDVPQLNVSDQPRYGNFILGWSDSTANAGYYELQGKSNGEWVKLYGVVPASDDDDPPEGYLIISDPSLPGPVLLPSPTPLSFEVNGKAGGTYEYRLVACENEPTQVLGTSPRCSEPQTRSVGVTPKIASLNAPAPSALPC